MTSGPGKREAGARRGGPLGLHLFGALVAFAVLYRLDLARELAALAGSVDSGAGPSPLALAFGGGWQDALVAAGAGGLLLLLGTLGPRRARWPRWVGSGLVVALLLAVGFVHRAHLRLVFSIRTGLTGGLLAEGLDPHAAGELVAYVAAADVAFVLLPALLFVVSLALGRRAGRPRLATAGALAAGLLLASLAGADGAASTLPPETGASPVWFLVADLATSGGGTADEAELSAALGVDPLADGESVLVLGAAPPSAVPAPHPAPVGAPSAIGADATADSAPPPAPPFPPATGPLLRLSDPRITAQGPLEKRLPAAAGEPWNLVYVVLESTGTRYLLGETTKGELPMPFLRRVADEGWFLRRHRSPSNSSATSIFAQLSGLYPLPSRAMFAMREDIRIPSLFSFLGDRYETFLVTPGKLTYFFPQHFLRASGLTEMHGFRELDVPKSPAEDGLSKDEPATVGFFLERLRRARPPFAAVYYSYVPHWEYTDYGPEYRAFRGTRLLDRYHNNLRLLDRQLERIVTQLREDGRLDSTILVFVGDHGEAFGQHDQNWAHAQASYEENYETVAILWQPRLFPPRVVEWETSHVDLLPTLLDALGRPYDPGLLQGESLFQTALARKAHFVWGKEGTLGLVDDSGAKVLVSVTEKRCWAFDLRRDPLERHELGCERYGEQARLLRDYREFQSRILVDYNAACARGEPFHGRRQPLPERRATGAPPAGSAGSAAP